MFNAPIIPSAIPVLHRADKEVDAITPEQYANLEKIKMNVRRDHEQVYIQYTLYICLMCIVYSV